MIVLFWVSVHAKLRNATLGYKFASSFFLRCLYENEDGDPDSPEVGFLKGPLLLHVGFRPSLLTAFLTIALISGLLLYIYIPFLCIQREFSI